VPDPSTAEDATPEAPAPSIGSLPLPHRVAFGGFAALLVAALAFYLWWGLTTGVWIDNGVYSVVVTLAGFGLAGMWLMTPNPTRPIPDRR
jgi:hypothetical protein